MATLQNSLLLCALSFTILLPSSLAQDSPQDYVDAHNAARAQVSVPPIAWDTEAALKAQIDAKKLKSTSDLLYYSISLFGNVIASDNDDMSSTDAVQMWANEKQFYNYNSNSCDPGKVCGNYTQMVWKNSVKLGCAKVTRDNNLGMLIVCKYDPPGNVDGEKPY